MWIRMTNLIVLAVTAYVIPTVCVQGNDVEYLRKHKQIFDTDAVYRGLGARNMRQLDGRNGIASLDENDLIYNNLKGDSGIPLVIEEYNLIFFRVAKCATTAWIRFFARLEGNDNWCGTPAHEIHKSKSNKLRVLSSYSIEKVQEMMTSSNWTKAIFVRNPKPRILSAFLDKSIKNAEQFERWRCPNYAKRIGGNETQRTKNREICYDRHKQFDFFIHNIITVMWDNLHWRSCFSVIDEKWWPYINYVATMDNLKNDAEHFLKTIRSNIDDISAWDRIGKTGWSANVSHSCEGGNSSFLSVKADGHTTNSDDVMHTYYTPKLENFVEGKYADDYDNKYFQFERLQLFDHKEEEEQQEEEEAVDKL